MAIQTRFDDVIVSPAPSKRKRLSWRTMVRAILPVLGTLTFALLLWSVLSYTETVSRIILPTPTDTAKAFATVVTAPGFFGHFAITMTETFGGGVIGVAFGLVGGCVVALSPAGRRAIEPIMIMLQAVPALVLAPLMLVWFGYGINSKIALVILSTFFPVFVTTVQGIRGTPEAYLKLMASLKAGRGRTFFSVRLPYALPSIFAGLRAAVASAFSAAVVTEMVGALRGLGVLVLTYNQTLQIPEVFAMVFIMIIIGMIVYYLAELADRRLVFWRGR